ncbi:hypothetical protein C8J57DRAFT_1215806 [Mycena rebaudengoi]|nr:hypothetical protein C8J57DRAFT_1215806 [Mycena rebaudengoi]
MSLKFPTPLYSGTTAWNQPPEDFALWFRFNENTTYPGVPSKGPEWIFDLRNVRGHNTVEAQARGDACMRTEYAKLVDKNCLDVADGFTASAGVLYKSSNVDLACALGATGLSKAEADDAWQFALKSVEAREASPEKMSLLSTVEQTVKEHGRPQSMHEPSEDKHLKLSGNANSEQGMR